MRIDRLIIKNFKGFEERVLDFPQGGSAEMLNGSRVMESPEKDLQGSFHLLIGENGSGKSTALDALAIAVGIWHVARPTAGWRAIRPGEARLVARPYDDTVRFDPQPDPSIMAQGSIGGQPMEWTRMNKGFSTKTTNQHAKRALQAVEGLLARSRTDEKVTLPVIASYSAGRAFLPAKERTRAFEMKLSKVSRFDAYYYCLDGRTRDREINQWFLFEAVETGQRGHKRQGLLAVEEAVLRCVPGATHLRIDGDRKEVVIGLRNGEMPFYSLSDGQRSMLALVADLAIKAVILNPHLGRDAAKKSPGVVLIDELDMCLHPTWQQHVLEDLRAAFPNVQFIASTHSPFLVQTARQGEVLKMDGNLAVEPSTLSIEEVARLAMDVTETEKSPRYQEKLNTAREYLKLVNEAREADPARRAEIHTQVTAMLAPFTDNPAYTALLERKGIISKD